MTLLTVSPGKAITGGMFGGPRLRIVGGRTVPAYQRPGLSFDRTQGKLALKLSAAGEPGSSSDSSLALTTATHHGLTKVH